MDDRIIETAWQDFARESLPLDFPETRRELMRITYYAGAVVVLEAIVRHGPGPIEGLYAECMKFAAENDPAPEVDP